MSKYLHILVGPPGSGKSTFAHDLIYNDGDHGAATVYVNQDTQGNKHLEIFNRAILAHKDIIVDRMNFNKLQRAKYLVPAKAAGYQTKITVLHESTYTCYNRMTRRTNHPTIKDAETATKVLRFFFKGYERPTDDEADRVVFRYPSGVKRPAIVCDLDGTLFDVTHRRHFVRDGNRNWKAFFDNMDKDPINPWCADMLKLFSREHEIVFCSGRPDDYRDLTVTSLKAHDMTNFGSDFFLFMRLQGDSRRDDIIKEIILDFEILTRFVPYFMIDDRDQVVHMWRRRGYTCLQCDFGDF